jgi:energy-coupling factor transporter ATP-binding protein EcfA2
MITSVYFENFKVLENYSLQIKDFNILVGINNCGKSTILDAFRILQGAYRYACRYNPQLIEIPDTKITWGWRIPDSSIPIILENIQTDYSDSPSKIRYRFGDNKNLYIHFEKDQQVKLTFDTEGKPPTTAGSFRKEFNINLAIVPTLGPFEIEEDIVDAQYLNRWFGSRRSSRMFRNIWYQDPTDFELFKDTIEKTWTGMSIKFPEKAHVFEKRLFMFFEENRIPREICWADLDFKSGCNYLHIFLKTKAQI